MRRPEDLSREDLINVLDQIQILLYWERDPTNGFLWNPGKFLDCPAAISQIDDIMGGYGLHPASGTEERLRP